ncbi:MAG: response regulator [Propylenella sp.]
MAPARVEDDSAPGIAKDEIERDESRVGVLIVEDEFLVALEMEQMLIEANHEVLAIVDSERAAVTEDERLEPDIILMDIALRRGDGIAAARTIRQRRDVPVIFVSANADPDTLARAAEVQPAAYIRKPFGGPELLGTLNEVLKRFR